MTHTITSETGATFSYTNEAEYLESEDWYNAQSKSDIIAYCHRHNVRIFEDETDLYPRGDLLPDWADIAMHAYAQYK